MQLINQNADAEITKCATYNESNAQLLLQKWEALENCVVRGHNGWWKWLNKSKKSALCYSDRWILIRYLLFSLSKTFKTEINDLANLIILSHGCVVGWFSPALPTLLSDDTPLITGPISNEEISWISSMSSIGALVGTFIFGFMASQIGPLGVVFYSLCISTIAFLGDKYFPILLEAIHLHGCLLVFAINCCIGLFFVASMKETRGQSLDSIQSTGNQLSAHKDTN